jgi:hypothetical protein
MLGVQESMTWYSSSERLRKTRLTIEEVTEHETPPRCIVHGAILVEENDFLENMCEKIVREREIQWVFFLFCPHEKWKCFLLSTL